MEKTKQNKKTTTNVGWTYERFWRPYIGDWIYTRASRCLKQRLSRSRRFWGGNCHGFTSSLQKRWMLTILVNITEQNWRRDLASRKVELLRTSGTLPRMRGIQKNRLVFTFVLPNYYFSWFHWFNKSGQ